MPATLLVLDIDGTLRPHGEPRVPKENVDALRTVQKAGVKLVIATGRCRAELPAKMLRGIRPDYWICAAGAQLRAQLKGDAACIESTQTVNLHVEQIREAALKLRMIEIGDTFNRFHRVVRDVSQQLGKDIRLEIQGADTELDKAVIDRLADPLTHLVRNAIDHGIEPADQRLAAGKSAEGHLRLDAYHESGMIVIEVADDGHGLNTQRIREKAVARGLIDAQANLSDHDVQMLIFAAGFSTADNVSDLSGRGVGMDVVRSAIDALRGTIEIDSRPGEGCTFRIRLPLTLAIIDGFLISLGDDYFVIPLDMVT